MTSPSDQTSFMPLASGPRQPAYWQPPTGSVPASGGWGQPAQLWTSRPVPPAQNGSLPAPPGDRRRLLLIGLLVLMTVAAGLMAVLYMNAASDASEASASLATARSEAATASEARREAEDARDEAEDRAATAEDERDAAQTTAQNLQECQQASKDLLTALNGDPNAQATTDAATDALTRMARTCR